jgi:hypothetical protein
VFIPILITLFYKEGNQLGEILGEGQEVLDSPQEILKPITGLIVGLVVGCWLVRSFPSTFCTIISLMHFHAPTYPFIDPSSSASWLGKGN